MLISLLAIAKKAAKIQKLCLPKELSEELEGELLFLLEDLYNRMTK